MSFLPVVGQKYRFSLPFLRGKMTIFSKNVKKIDILIFEFLDQEGGSRGSEQVINPKKQVRRPMEAGKTLFWQIFFLTFLKNCWVDNSAPLNSYHFSLDAFDLSESRVFTVKFSNKTRI